jgi:serine/threonine protein kinase/tetratricopeptide (TPR) repeat protein
MKRLFQSNRAASDKSSASKPKDEAQKAEPLSTSDEEANAKTEAELNKIAHTMVFANATPKQMGVPASFGRYEVQRSLGAGGYGDVYLGHDDQLDRQVAIKVLRPKSSGQPTEDDRSLREARNLARLRHPGIVTVHDVGVQDNKVYIVSDFLEGTDLAHWLRNNRPSWPESVRITMLVADALAHAHARLIVHRDIKPANIILTTENTPVLVDFGIALGDDEATGGVKGKISGTPKYMSPEQAEGAAHRIDGRTDVYSLGVVLYELLTGRVPFRAKNLQELLRQVIEDEPQPPRQLVPQIPVDLERMCLKALAKKQQDRYTTAGDFAEDLRRVVAPVTDSSIVAPAESLSTFSDQTPSTSSDTSGSIRRAREAERRQLTVLVCGSYLLDSAAYLEMDAEDQAGILSAFHERCEQAVLQFGGTVVQRNEKGLLACFGFPVAYENAARRAARSGLAILEAMKSLDVEFNLKNKLNVTPWVGIHTGPAIAETKDGVVSLVGEARNVTLRLEDVAVPGQVICTEVTHEMFKGRFQCGTLGYHQIKGLTQPLELFQVERVSVTGSLLEAVAPAELSPLTGRDHEISLLKERWEQAQEGMGQVVLLIGEAGLGKSRLVHTLKQHVLGQTLEGEDDPPVIEWRCSPHFQNTRLYPAVDFFERALAVDREGSHADRFELLLNQLRQYGLDTPEVIPLWASLLSLPTPENLPPLSLSAVRLKEETFRAIQEWLHVRAERRPILFIVEDLHWVDASTLEFLGQFLAEGLHDSILTILTFRPEFKTPWPAVAHQTGLALNRLTRSQVGDLMRQKTKSELSDGVIEQVYDRAGGVPLFVEEFTKIVQESDPQQLDTGGLLTREIPATLQDLVMARLDRLESERDLAQLAATLGREFSYEMLAAVAGRDEPTLKSELSSLIQSEIIFQKGRPPTATYIFKHSLLEDALYNSLVKAKRQQFHRRIAEVLEAQFPQTAETRPELLAHHFTEAGLTEKAIGYWLSAGLRSQERSANVEAIGHLTNGLELIGTLPESPARDVKELQFLTTLGTVYIAARGYAAPEIGPTLERARELCRLMGEQHLMFGVMLGAWEWRIVRGELGICSELAAEGMELSERLKDPGVTMEALFMPGVTSFYRGQFANSRSYHEKALAEYDDRARTKFWTTYSGHDGGVTQRCYLFLDLWHLGYPDQAFKLERETQELARTIGHAFSRCHALDFSAFLFNYCRLGNEVQTAAEEELAIGIDQGFALWQALGLLHKGAALFLKRQLTEAVPHLVKGLNAFRDTGARIRVPCYLGILADAYTQTSNFEDARKTLVEALSVLEKNDNRTHESELYRLKGELHLASTENQWEAEECFLTSIDIARSQQSKAWELRAATSLARLWQRQGRREEARSLLAQIYETYTEGFTTPDLVDAKALLDSLGNTGLPGISRRQ